MAKFFTGTPEALALIRERQREKKAQIRAAGLRTEKQFFGLGGEFDDEAAAKQRTNPKLSWPVLLDYLKNEGWKPLGKKGTASFGRTVGTLDQALQLEARAWRVLFRATLYGIPKTVQSLGTYKDLDQALIAANRQASDYLGTRKKNQKKNPMIECLQCGRRTSGKKLQHFEGCPQLKFIQTYGRPKPHRKNPITIVGNPPKRIRADVAGVMYNRVWEVQAEKTGDKHKGFWYHPFKKGSDVQMLALDSGDIMLHSKAGKKLWKEDE